MSGGTVTAWHFCSVTEGGFETSRGSPPLPVIPGRVLRHKGEAAICFSGLHGSRRILDALHYARGDGIARVELRRIVDEQADKLVARERKALWVIDGEAVLRRFARRCALDAVHLWNAPDVVVHYLKSGDESIRVAAWAAAWDVARDAAWDAAWDAAGAAAWAAARAAAWAAAWDAAWDAARARQERRLVAMVHAERKRVS